MAQRRSPNRVSSNPTTNLPLARRNYTLRRSPASRRRVLSRLQQLPPSHTSLRGAPSSIDTLRPVLVALHPNLRRLPSRLLPLSHKDNTMRDSTHAVQAGAKRKRVASSNENAHTSTRGSGRLKRLRSEDGKSPEYNSDASETSSMDVDTPSQWANSDESEPEEDGEEVEDVDEDSTDDYLITEAQASQLLRLRKDELVRLYISAGLSNDAEILTKSEIAEAIISARDDVASLPPSSPPGRGDGNSSEYSSDDGNVAGDETDSIANSSPRNSYGPAGSLRRRATTNDLGRTNGRPAKGRSLSMGHLYGNGTSVEVKKTKGLDAEAGGSGSVSSRRRTSARRSPSAGGTSTVMPDPYFPSPPATRLRSRQVSNSTDVTAVSSTGQGRRSGKGKGKQVEFSDDVQVNSQTLSRRTAREREREQERQRIREDESDLTELEELEDKMNAAGAGVSPRRLRSKDKDKKREQEREKGGEGIPRKKRKKGEDETGRRITPMRKAKGKIGSLKEDEDEDENEDENEVEEDEQDELEEDGEEQEEDNKGEEEDDEAEEDEVDELVSSASVTPPPTIKGRRTPVRRRLRPRRVQTHTPPSDGDDEGDDEEELDEDTECGQESVDEGDEEHTVVIEPRKLRNGKIVGEEEMEQDLEEDIGEDQEEEDEEDEEEAEVESVDVEDIDLDAEGETEEEETTDDDIDLTIATAKTLVRLRRDDLVRLCETRDLDIAGTKPQLAEALLQWRDRQGDAFSSPSSAGTVRPPSTVRRRRHLPPQSTDKTSPVLMRSSRFHMDEPRTPPVSDHRKEAEPELELDLESLGLEDREIPPDKLTKLEKIGSGGFKDVYIGKFKGRKIAISEFRGQLSAMDIKELKLLGGFDHPNIVRFLGVSIPENTRETPVMIVSELCSNGDLFDYVRNVQPPSLHKILGMMLDIARGLEYLHLRKPSVIHRDCKSSNILITSRGTAKIADFGLAKVKQSTRSMVRSLVGTVNWQAPELWHAHPKYNHKVDVFSCAMVYWEMLQWHLPNKKFPWEGMNEHAIYEIVGAKRQRPSLSGLRKQWRPDIIDIIERMWAQEHQERPTMSEVVEELEQLVRR